MHNFIKSIFLFFFFVSAALAQLTAPVLYPASGGTFINYAQIGFFVTVSGPTTCYTYTTNGTTPSTPTASVAGACDNNGSIYATFSTNAQWAAINIPNSCTSTSTCTLQLKAIFTQAGQTNSSVTSASYTVYTTSATNPMSAPSATNVTNATGNQTNTEPFMLKDARGRILLFYNACNCAAATDGSGTSWVAWQYTSNGSSWSVPSNKSCPGATDPSTGCFYDVSAMNMANNPVGGGMDYNNNLVLFISQWQQPGITNTGVLFSVCANSLTNDCTLGSNWTSPAFLTTPSHTTANQFDNPTSNMITIPPGSSGVTGACATGCSFIPILGINGCSACTGLIFNTDGTLTAWSDPVAFPSGFYPFTTEEKAMVWAGGMNLLMLSRPGTNDINGGGPTSIAAATSSNLGTSWNSYTPVSTTETGGATNLSIGPCPVAPQVEWVDIFTRPAVAINPNNSSLASLFYGERLTCSGVGTFQLHGVTFNIATAFSNVATTLPAQRTVLSLNSAATQLHTAYCYAIPLNSTQILAACEQGHASTNEDIMVVPVSFPSGQTTGGSISLGGNTTLQ